jgi:Family of unknown function (DUF6505)
MNALAAIRLDASFALRFKNAAHPSERAVSGAFVFAGSHPSSPRGKARALFRSGFVGFGSLGWPTLVQIVEATEAERARALDVPAHRLTERLEVPNLALAGAVVEQEIDFVVSLADHPSGTLAAVTRMSEGRSIGESFRALRPAANKPTNAYAFLQASSENEQRAEEIDLTSLTRRVAR